MGKPAREINQPKCSGPGSALVFGGLGSETALYVMSHQACHSHRAAHFLRLNTLGKIMKAVQFAALLMLIAPAASGLQAQQTATKPVVTAAPPVSTAAANPDSTQSKASNSPDYVIGPDDSLSINVWKEPTVSGTLPVRPDGMISLPLVGDMRASGFTPTQLSHEIAEHLKKYINDPAVTVTVLGVNSKHVYLVGEVGKVGPLSMTPDMTPLQAIATAGGLSPYANGKHIYILRTVNGKQQKIPFDYKKAIKDGNMQGVTLVSGDTIVVP